VLKQPKITSNGNRTTVTHREYVAEVSSVASGNFAVSSYTINPGLSVSFPWLSQVAPAYESYQFEKLEYVYEPSISASTSGVVSLAIEYDVSDSDPTSKGDMMSNTRAVRAACWQRASYLSNMIDAGVMTKRRYTRAGAVPSGKDARAFDLGRLLVGTAGFGAAVVNSGEIYVDYVISFYTPQKDTPGLAMAHSAKIVSGAGIDKTHTFGTGAATVTGDLPVTATVNDITFTQPGEYIIACSGTGTGMIGPTVTVSGAAATTAIDNLANAAGTSEILYRKVRILNSGEYIRFDYSGSTTLTAHTAYIGVLSYSL
jgi:hypothetical protein